MLSTDSTSTLENNNNNSIFNNDISINELIKSNDLRIKLMLKALESNEIVEDSEDTRFEKLKDRFDRLFADPLETIKLIKKYSLLDIPLRVLNQSTIHLQNEQIISLNLKFIALLLRHQEINAFFILNSYSSNNINSNADDNHNNIYNNRIIHLIYDIVVHYTSDENALIRDSAINTIITLLSLNSGIKDIIIDDNNIFPNIFNNEVNLLNTMIHNIFESFKYPSNFVSRSAEKLLYTTIHLCKNEEKLVMISEYINQSLVNDANIQSIIDVKLSLLDLFIHLLSDNKDIEFLILNNIIQKSCLMLLNNDRLVRERVVEFISLSLQSKDLYNHIVSLRDLFKSIISKLIQSKQKDLMITSIDLIGILDSTNLFTTENSSIDDHVFNQLNNLIEAIIENQDNNRLSITDSIIFSLMHTSKLILTSNNNYLIQSNKKWVEFIFKVATLQAFKQSNSLKTSTKTQREAINCIQYLDLNSINIDTNNITIEQQHSQITPLIILLDSLKSQNRVIVKQTFTTFYQLLTKNQNLILLDNNFLHKLYTSISNVTMNPSGDIREVGLSFIYSIYNNNGDVNCKEMSKIGEWLLDNNICSMVVNKLVDSDSYVRSTALDVIKALSYFENGWNKLINTTKYNSSGNANMSSLLNRDRYHIIDDSKPTKQINDDLMNHNQINLVKYTEMLKLEHMEQHQTPFDAVSMTDSTEVQSLHGDIDFEWNDEDFREMLSRTQEEAANFLTEEEVSIDVAPPSLNSLSPNQNYPFPYSIILFFSDEESYPRISSIELLIKWINQSHTVDFVNELLQDNEINNQYEVNYYISRLMNDTYWEVKSSCIKLFKNILTMKNGLKSLINISAINLLVDKLNNSLEDNIIKMASINCLKDILQVVNETTCKDISEDGQIQLLLSLDLQFQEKQCSKELEYTEDEEEDISIFIDLKSVGTNVEEKNKIDCY